MKKISVFVLFLALCDGAYAQQVMDGSDKNLSPNVSSATIKAVMAMLLDPYSAQFEALRPWAEDAGSICGRVNAKNKMGGYAGFQNFRYIIDQDKAFIHENTGCK